MQVVTTSPINLIAAFGLALGAVFGKAGTFVVQPNLQALLWAIDGAGLVMAAPLLTLRHFRMGHDLVAGGLLVFAIADYDARGMHCRAFHVLFNVGVYGR